MDSLILPKRYEVLENVADKNSVSLSSIIKKIPESSKHIDQLLREISIGNVGKLELINGKSGSGKTTFVKSLSLFYSNVQVNIFEHSRKLTELSQLIEGKEKIQQNITDIYLLTDRDNPTDTETELREAFENLRRVFRTRNGNVLVLWPITDDQKAKEISRIAWDIGRDSLVRPSTKGIMAFNGLKKEEYWETADITSQSLNNEGLESYGLLKESLKDEINDSETIGEFYSVLETKAAEHIETFEVEMQEKLLPKVWIVLAGDDSVEIERTVRALTQGTKNKIDAERVIEYLDDNSNNSAYLSEWRKRRNNAIFLLRQLDVRLFDLSPNAALASIRCFGDDTIKISLIKKSETESNTVDAIKKLRIFQVLTVPEKVGTISARSTSQETKDEYNRIQVLASGKDHEFNKCLGNAFTSALQDFGMSCKVTSEKRNLGEYSLQPDIQIIFDKRNIICLEPTWRTTGIEREGKRTQNTLTTGHIQKYVLEKIMEYLKVIGL
ncbi:hypothetical protein [Photobacterium sp. 53610]|uniref:hypothetical protein n=1 Tax=Photobacterium sp. 53610 TaxID=3102789 RepID=UPI002ED9A694